MESKIQNLQLSFECQSQNIRPKSIYIGFLKSSILETPSDISGLCTSILFQIELLKEINFGCFDLRSSKECN